MATITKAQLARLTMARLRRIAPNESIASEDQATIEAEIDLCKARLESSIFGGVVLWTDDDQIPLNLVEGFLLCMLNSVAAHYQAATSPMSIVNDGYLELCRQLSQPYQSEYDGVDEQTSITLLSAVTVTGNSSVTTPLLTPITFQMWIAGDLASPVSASIKIWGSNDSTAATNQMNSAKSLLFTSSLLTGTGAGIGVAVATEFYLCNIQFKYYWAEVASISGTNATITVSAVSN